MATIDPSIALGVKPVQIESPVNALSRMLQVQGLQDQREASRMQIDAARRAETEQNALSNIYSTAYKDGKIDRNAVLSGAAQGGLGHKIPGLQKGFADADAADAKMQKDRLEAAHKRADLMGQAFGYVRQNPTVEAAHAVLDNLGAQGVLPPEVVQQYKLQTSQNPGSIAQLADQAFRSALEAKDQLPKFETRNLGGTTDTIAVDPVTQHARTVNSVANTQSPDNKASVGASYANLAETRRHHGVTEGNQAKTMEQAGWQYDAKRGGRVNVRTGEFQPVTQDGQPIGGEPDKPLSGAVLKQLTEVRDNAVTLDRLLGGFKEDYASKGVLGFGADTSLMAKGVLGRDKDAVEWWKNYRKQAELVERHSLFGAALTPTEQDSWRGADIGPGMDKDVIKRNLQTRAELTKKVLETTRMDLVDAGNSEARVNAIAGRGPQAKPQAPAAAVGALSPEELKELAELRKRFGK